MKKKNIVIFGAGAIGRGFLPWVINFDKYNIIYVDSNLKLVQKINLLKKFTTFKIENNKYKKKIVYVKNCYSLEQFSSQKISNVKCFIFNVGPRNVNLVAKKIVGTKTPIIINENNPKSVDQVKEIVKHKKVFFAVPDVITSNTACNVLKKNNPLSIITENGVLFIEKNNIGLKGFYNILSKKKLLKYQWVPKLYLHNTPHCIAAYLGSILGVKFLHEAMQNFFINQIVTGAMDEMLQSVKSTWNISHKHLEMYANKELDRFRCNLLFDPISRVAREPLRKLELDGRLIHAAQLCFSSGVIPINILKGIVSALMYKNKKDPDYHLNYLRNAMGTKYFNIYILGLRDGEPLEIMLRNKTDEIIKELKTIISSK